MLKRLLFMLTIVVLIFCLNGCWNYRGLNQLSLVVGFAVDFDKKSNQFDVSYETADLSSVEKKSPAKGRVTHAKGKTLFAAARNSQLHEKDRLFFGSAHILVLSQELARDQGIMPTIEWFLREGECRESMCIAISMDDTAKTILEQKEAKSIISMTLHDILHEDKELTGTTYDTQLYQLYDSLYSKRKSAVLPVLRKIMNGDKEAVEAHGLAIIKGDRLTGFLTPEQSRYVLMLENELKGGVITLSMNDMPGDDISMRIFKNKGKKSFKYEHGKLTIKLDTQTDVTIGEDRSRVDLSSQQVIKKLESKAARLIKKDIENLVSALQREHKTDILGFGELIYKRNLKLWKKLSPKWDEMYPYVKVEVNSKVKIMNSAWMK